MTRYEKTAREMMEFIEKNPSCYHVVNGFARLLKEQGFQELHEEKIFSIQAGGKYYVTRNDSSIIAFCMPEKEMTNFQIVASHSDSPSFKIKENPEMKIEGHYIELNAEKYGGMLCAPWFDRPLSLAGRAVVRTEKGVQPRLLNVDRDLVMLPSLAIHMDRKLNEGYSYNAQRDMIPLFGDENAEGKYRELLAQHLQVKQEDILSSDIFLYNRMPGCIWGADREFISAPRLDDIECAYASMRALVNAENAHSVRVCCVFDNEEVGSTTKQGAASTFLKDVLMRICQASGKNQEEYLCMLADSFMVSADNAHAVHPNHVDKADPTNRPHMNKGIVIKYNANQKYTTDAVSGAIFREICRKSGVPVQTYVNRSDVPGGSTLGNIASTQVSIKCVDIGLAQLAMHSPYETAGIKDVAYLMQGLETFYSVWIRKEEQGNIILL